MATESSLTLTQDLTIPAAVAVDTNGDVYVANRGSAPSVVVYPQGQTTPSRVITSDLIEMPQQIAFDAARNLYISDSLMGVSELAYGSQEPTALNLQGPKRAEGIAIDPRDGNLFVSDEPSQKVFVYRPGNPQPLRATKITLACFLTIGTVRGGEYVFVPSCGNDDVWVMATDTRRVRGVLDFAGAGSACCIVIKPPGIP
jgi:DNA-binding beta-propeller fold protein YncE